MGSCEESGRNGGETKEEESSNFFLPSFVFSDFAAFFPPFLFTERHIIFSESLYAKGCHDFIILIMKRHLLPSRV